MGARYAVGVARCESYAPADVSEALRLAVERAGGWPAPVADAILLKTNALSPSPPEKAVTTHPEVLRAAVAALRRANDAAEVHIADSPGYIFTDAKRLFEKTGIQALTNAEGVTAGPLHDLGVAVVRGGDVGFRALPEARVARRYLEAPYCVNAAKLKTHVETEMSGCIKNIFGSADTETRKTCHRSTSQRRLAEAIVDLYGIRPPAFHILDAVVGMEGDGPSHGRPRLAGWILAGANALAVDWAACKIMGYGNPRAIPLIAAAVDRGIGPAAESQIDLRGAGWEELPVPGFRKSSGALRLLPTFLRGMAHSLVSIRPVLERSACTRCGICAKVCPTDAIRYEEGYPRIDAAKCVRCLCCHEMCPPGAMLVRKNLIARAVSGFRGEGGN